MLACTAQTWWLNKKITIYTVQIESKSIKAMIMRIIQKYKMYSATCTHVCIIFSTFFLVFWNEVKHIGLSCLSCCTFLTPRPDFNDRVFTVLSFLAVWSWNPNVKIKVHLMPLDISPILGSKDVPLILVHVFMILESQCQNKSTFNVGRQLSCVYFGFQGCPLDNGMCLWSWNLNLKIKSKYI